MVAMYEDKAEQLWMPWFLWWHALTVTHFHQRERQTVEHFKWAISTKHSGNEHPAKSLLQTIIDCITKPGGIMTQRGAVNRLLFHNTLISSIVLIGSYNQQPTVSIGTANEELGGCEESIIQYMTGCVPFR